MNQHSFQRVHASSHVDRFLLNERCPCKMILLVNVLFLLKTASSFDILCTFLHVSVISPFVRVFIARMYLLYGVFLVS